MDLFERLYYFFLGHNAFAQRFCLAKLGCISTKIILSERILLMHRLYCKDLIRVLSSYEKMG